ncbi:AAA family ATPase [Nonomuraea basaltis]|uniref:AAA family ATPase n=1 Tax=Nonomuraea basaltis TaxID=2495887 RepID=UPI0014873B00|nr:AAA family ATPase [Nonomuraea basaltis]
MSNLAFEAPVRVAFKSRVVIQGPSGSGLTWTSLRMARGMGGTVGVVDTNRGSAALYAEHFDFVHLPMNSGNPELLIEALAVAAEQRIDTLIVDSATMYWSGRGGLIAQVDHLTLNKYNGNNNKAWGETRGLEQKLFDALLSFPGHLIVTLRTRADYQLQDLGEGRMGVVKYGTKPEQRDNFDADFHFTLSLDMAHAGTVTKSRVLDVPVGAVVEEPGEDLGNVIAEWLGNGDPVPDAIDIRDQALDPAMTDDDLRELHRLAAKANLLRAAVLNEHREVEALGALIVREGEQAKKENRRAARPAAAPAQPAAEAQDGPPMPDNVLDDKLFVAQWAHAIAVIGGEDAEQDLHTVETNLRQEKADGTVSQNDYAHLYRLLEQRRASLDLPYGQPNTTAGAA